MDVTMLIMINIITILLCALAKQVTSQANDSPDFFPARILAQQKTIGENSDLYLTCSTFGASNKQTAVYVYLCKDGTGVERKRQKAEQNDSTFCIKRVGLWASGNYSCVYSIHGYSVSKATRRGDNTIQILVIANFLPADISLSGPPSVSEGVDVEFSCTVSGALEVLEGECRAIQSYLRRNQSILQVRPFDVSRRQATFTVQAASVKDSGGYSCVVLPSRCMTEHEGMVQGNNTVFLEVRAGLSLRVMVSCIVITLILSLCLCLIIKLVQTNTGSSAPSSECPGIQQANSHVGASYMLDEQQQQQQPQTEGQHLETHDVSEDSFSTDEGECFHEDPAADYDDCDRVYSVADDSFARVGPQFVYATSSREKK